MTTIYLLCMLYWYSKQSRGKDKPAYPKVFMFVITERGQVVGSIIDEKGLAYSLELKGLRFICADELHSLVENLMYKGYLVQKI